MQEHGEATLIAHDEIEDTESDQNDDSSFTLDEATTTTSASDVAPIIDQPTNPNDNLQTQLVDNDHSISLVNGSCASTSQMAHHTTDSDRPDSDVGGEWGKCIEYVDIYSDETKDYNRIWCNPSYNMEDYSELKRHRVYVDKVRYNQHHPRCVQSMDYSESFYLKHFAMEYSTRLSDSSSRVGWNYQAVVRKVSNNKQESQPQPNNCTHCNIVVNATWNPQQAKDAIESGTNIDWFLLEAHNLNSKLLLMQALHNSDYNVPLAKEEFVSLHRSNPKFILDYGDSEDFVNLFTTENFAKNKDFDYISQSLNCSKEVAILQYYRWKKSKPNNPAQYLQMKRDRNKESDYCEVCDDGGDLIVCDLCNKAYHLTCLAPSLANIPQGDWFCPECERRSPAKLRRHSGYHKLNGISDVHETTETTNGKHAIGVNRLESLRSIHKELSQNLNRKKYSAIERLPPVKERMKHATYAPTGMTWDGERGFWVANTNGTSNEALPDENQFEVENNQAIDTTTMPPAGSHPTDEPDRESSIRERPPQPKANDLLLLHGQTYEVRLPITTEGLLIFIERKSSAFISFSGYRQTSTGGMGFAQRTGAFMAVGDFILAVDSVSCLNKNFDEVRTMLKTTKPGSRIRCLTMFHPLNAQRPNLRSNAAFN